MTERDENRMLELLADQAASGLNEEEARELEMLLKDYPEWEDDSSFELAAAAMSLSNLEINEPLPENLRAKISAQAEEYFSASEKTESPATSAPETEETVNVFTPEIVEPKRPFWQWLGWAVAATACVLLALNLWFTRFQQPQIVREYIPTTPTATPLVSPAQEREQFLASVKDAIQTTWTNPKNPNEVLGDIVWSNSAQKGFLRLRGLPQNDPNKETYQLWIVDKTQKNPIDGGVFDITQTGEIVIPIDAKLKVKEPAQFAVTAEKPGGVVVSELGKVMAVAKI